MDLEILGLPLVTTWADVDFWMVFLVGFAVEVGSVLRVAFALSLGFALEVGSAFEVDLGLVGAIVCLRTSLVYEAVEVSSWS